MPEQEPGSQFDNGFYAPRKLVEWASYLVGFLTILASSGIYSHARGEGAEQAIIDTSPASAIIGLSIIGIGRAIRRNY